MSFITFIISFLIALGFSLLLIHAFKREGPGPLKGLLFFVSIIFLFSWAIGGWMIPIEPLYHGVSWIGHLLLAVTVLLLLMIMIPKNKYENLPLDQKLSDDEIFKPEKSNAAMGATFGIFFWLLIFLMLIIISIRYFNLI